jgi:hypothetical protein
MSLSIRTSLAALSIAALVGAFPASAGEWTRDTVHGGRITRSVARDGLIYSGKTTRVGPNGGTYSSTTSCRNGAIDRCHRSFSATGPNGNTYSGHQATARGRYQVRSVGAITGPRGNIAVGGRRHWR